MRRILTLALFLGTVASAWPASFAVDSVADAPDAAPGNGACATTGGVCTLRAAVQEANALAGADAVTLPAGTYMLAIAGNDEDQSATGDLDVTEQLTVTGADAATTIIDGGTDGRVVHVLGATVVIERVTLQQGDATLDDCDPTPQISQGCGGAVCQYGGDLTLRDVVVRDSTAFNGGGVCLLGGTVLVNRSTVSGNTAVIGGGIIAGPNGGAPSVTITGSTVSANVAQGPGGGGLVVATGTLALAASTVSGNSAPAPTSIGGGGIWTSAGVITTIRNTTVSGNSTAGRGGGILNMAFCTPPPAFDCVEGGSITLNNVTITANADGGAGGGVLNTNLFNDFAAEPVLVASNSLLAGNRPRDCGGRLTSAGHNLLLNPDGCAVTGVTTGDVTGVDPLLGPLAPNGGPTATHALWGSAAANTGNPAAPGSGNPACEASDQRGVVRPFGVACDIGAYESQCGNGVVDPGEDCEDGNTVDGDGCDTNCTATGCGNGVVTAGEQCDDANTVAGRCCSPTCQYEPVTTACPDEGNPCTTGACDGGGHCVHTPQNGTPCDDGIGCNGPDTCLNGTCRSGSVCAGRECNGIPCDDGDPCTTGDACFMSVCVPGPSCGTCTTCNPGVGCVPGDDGVPCSDGDLCTENETCSAGVCTAGDVCGACTTCVAGVGCRMPPATCTGGEPGGASITFKESATPGRDSVRFTWRSDTPVTKADFGEPTTATPYRLCVFDGDGRLALGAEAPAGGMCGGDPCWREKTRAFSYRDRTSAADGLSRIELREGDPASIKVQGGGPALSLGALPLLAPVRARISRTDTNACWDAAFSTRIGKNTATAFKAKSD